jgi:hypothetical protein
MAPQRTLIPTDVTPTPKRKRKYRRTNRSNTARGMGNTQTASNTTAGSAHLRELQKFADESIKLYCVANNLPWHGPLFSHR